MAQQAEKRSWCCSSASLGGAEVLSLVEGLLVERLLVERLLGLKVRE